MNRPRDIIDVTIDAGTAWADLRATIYNREGVDIERGKQFAISTKRVLSTGAAVTHAFVAIPRDAVSPEDVMRRG